MNHKQLEGKQVLDPKVIALMSSPHATIPGGASTWVSYCYGLQLGNFRGVHVVEHLGDRPGFGSQIRMIPSRHIAIIVLTNRTSGLLPATMEKAMDLVLPLKPDLESSSSLSK